MSIVGVAWREVARTNPINASIKLQAFTARLIIAVEGARDGIASMRRKKKISKKRLIRASNGMKPLD